MPKIEVNEKLFFSLLGETWDYATLEDRLTCGKAELDEKPDASLAPDVAARPVSRRHLRAMGRIASTPGAGRSRRRASVRLVWAKRIVPAAI